MTQRSEQPNEVPQRIMVITAHPDDADFSCSGSVAKWVAQGAEVVYVLCTSGDKGTSNPEAIPEQVAANREEEQLNSAKVLGLKAVEFLREPDGGVEDTPELRGKIVRMIRKHRPDRVVTQDPFRRPHTHRDHRTVGLVTMDAVFPYARDYLHYPEHIKEGLEPHIVKEVLLIMAGEPDYWEDITDYWETKLAAGLCHRSQIGDPENWERRRREQSEQNLKNGALTEAFKRISYVWQ